MSLSKKTIAKNISSKIKISEIESSSILNSFINAIKTHSVNSNIKIPSFGTFIVKKTPQRIGRNPKTKEEFVIPSRSKLTLAASEKLKKIIN
jgi:nucleoid DNA-binding protein|tara:strand:- start:388 stop:663 length:276 start_codon:yes stop_codon:yes gene_type:complete